MFEHPISQSTRIDRMPATACHELGTASTEEANFVVLRDSSRALIVKAFTFMMGRLEYQPHS